jgi:hypothetical protein
MAVFKNGLFINYNGEIINPVSNIAASVAANNFFQSAGITNQQQRYAIYNLVSDLQTYNIWDKMKAVYPFVGQPGVSSSFELNLKDVNTFRGIFNGGWTFASTGITGNGSNAFMETNLSSSISLARDSISLSVYSRTTGTDGDIGDKTISSGFSGMFNGTSFVGYLGDLNNISVSQASVIGFFTISRSNLTQVNFYKNGNALGTNPKNSNAGSLNTGTLVIGRANTSYSNKENSFASIGDGLTDTEAANLYIAVQRFQTTLGRQV